MAIVSPTHALPKRPHRPSIALVTIVSPLDRVAGRALRAPRGGGSADVSQTPGAGAQNPRTRRARPCLGEQVLEPERELELRPLLVHPPAEALLDRPDPARHRLLVDAERGRGRRGVLGAGEVATQGLSQLGLPA